MSINVVNVSPQIHPNIVCSENCSSGLDNCKSYTSSKDELFKATAKIRGFSLLERVGDLPFVWRKGGTALVVRWRIKTSIQRR